MNSQTIKIIRPLTEIKVMNNSKTIFEIQQKVKTQQQQEFEELEKQIIKLKEEELDEQLQQAYKQGFEAGYKQFKQEADAKFQQQFKYLDKVSSILLNAKNKILKVAEQVVVKLALEIAGKILKQQVTTFPEAVINIVKNVLQKISSIEKNIIVRVNSADYENLTQHLEKLRQDLPHINHLEFVADSRISPGGCIVETDYSTIDATIESQLDEIRRLMFKEMDYEPASKS